MIRSRHCTSSGITAGSPQQALSSINEWAPLSLPPRLPFRFRSLTLSITLIPAPGWTISSLSGPGWYVCPAVTHIQAPPNDTPRTGWLSPTTLTYTASATRIPNSHHETTPPDHTKRQKGKHLKPRRTSSELSRLKQPTLSQKVEVQDQTLALTRSVTCYPCRNPRAKKPDLASDCLLSDGVVKRP